MTMPVIALLRPDISAGEDAAVCRACGWQPVVCSTVRLLANTAALQQLPELVRRADVLFWVSPGAVALAADYVGNDRGQRHVAVGGATAEKLRQQGFTNIDYPQDGHDSEAVLRLPLWHEHTGRLLIIGGADGRTWLADGVRSLGWQAAVTAVYHREAMPVNWTALTPYIMAGCLKAVYATTAAAVDTWFAQMPPALHVSQKSLLYLTHHQRVAAAVTRHGVSATVVASLRDGLLSINLKRSGVHE